MMHCVLPVIDVVYRLQWKHLFTVLTAMELVLMVTHGSRLVGALLTTFGMVEAMPAVARLYTRYLPTIHEVIPDPLAGDGMVSRARTTVSPNNFRL